MKFRPVRFIGALFVGYVCAVLASFASNRLGAPLFAIGPLSWIVGFSTALAFYLYRLKLD